MPNLGEQLEFCAVRRQDDGHYSVHSEIVIEARPEIVWGVLRDFDAMASWSSSLKTITGDIRHGGRVQSHFYAMGETWVADHEFIFEDGVRYGWSDPLTGAFAGIRDNHHFVLEPIDALRTRFIQSDEFTGEGADIHGPALARVGFESYPRFNSELRDRVATLKRS